MSIKLFDFRPRQFSGRSWSIGWMCGIGFCAISEGFRKVDEPVTAMGLLALLTAVVMYRCLPLKIND